MRSVTCTCLALSVVFASHVARADPPKAARAHRASAPKPPPPPSADPDEARRAEAIAHFDRGRERLRERAWDAALAEFLVSRQLFPGRGNTQNAAICLRELHRYDEALDMFETLLREFPGSADDVRAIGAEIDALRPRVGSIDVRVIEPAAQVMVDGRSRGATPMSSPLRVPAGTHVVRVYKDRFAPLERQIEVAGEAVVPLTGALVPLTHFGSLHVAEASGRNADVLVDGVTVGKTPWDGVLSVGPHVVALRDGDAGTAPASATVASDAPATLTLAAVPLDAELRIEPVPAGASVALDGVTLGHGLWEGRLPRGAHRVEVAAEGFLPSKRDVSLAADQRQTLAVILDRDPNSPLWIDKTPAMWVAELDVALLVSPEIGGHVSNACRGDSACSRSLPLGEMILLRPGYQFRSGFTVEADLGFLSYGISTKGRPADFTAAVAPLTGRIDDSLSLSEFMFGASVAQHATSRFPWTVRIGAGLSFGKASDDISFSVSGPLGPVGSYRTSIDARSSHLWIGPDAHYGFRISRHFEANVGLHVLALQILNQPSIDQPYPAGGIPTGPGTPPVVFQPQSLSGKTTIFAGLGIGFRAGI